MNLERHKPQFFDKPWAKNYRKYCIGNSDVKEQIKTKLHLNENQFNGRVTGRVKCTPLENEAANSILWQIVKQLFTEFIETP